MIDRFSQFRISHFVVSSSFALGIAIPRLHLGLFFVLFIIFNLQKRI